MRLSIIIPALNEAATLPATLAPLQALRARGHQVLLVDGGSADATAATAKPLVDRVLTGRRGRATQMNAGAAAADGDILLFLHADTRLDAEIAHALLAALPSSGRRWGRFDVAIAGRSPALPLIATLMNLRSRLTGIATGDQGIFVERGLFVASGGFPEQPLMEDIEFCRRLKRTGEAPLCLRQRLVTSGRRWDDHGALRTILTMWRLRFAYWRGVDPRHLAPRYAAPAAAAAPTLQIFAKEPVPGTVKTRLARTLGAEAAARVYAELAAACFANAQEARRRGSVAAVELWCAAAADAPRCAAWAAGHGFALHRQCDGDLGARMRHAVDSALARGERVLLIGTDCPALDADALGEAAAALADHDAVLVPAEDGGYVAIGLARAVDAFTGIAWSTADVAAHTRARFAAAGIRWRELDPRWDVDDEAGLARWQRAHRSGDPPAAKAVADR
ncbi:MAG: TIGR04283 family arsenosugar biosynthesis glycosyltransferase [Betaproteobacteria bacterium]|nr:TIGR04283 family arsenosugar biosynthesis glycosyltransferase [Betaproteobacteria bacterium]